MTVLETIQTRHSVQRYINTPLPEVVVATLQQKIEEINAESGLHIQLVTNEPKVCSVMAYSAELRTTSLSLDRNPIILTRK